MKELDREIQTGPYAHMTGRDKFWLFVDRSSDDKCWLWNGRQYSNGYGCFRLFGKDYLAHRLSLYLTDDVRAGGMVVMHSCDNPQCVNPSHLSIGTHRDNVLDMMAKGRNVVTRGSKAHQAFLTEGQAAEIKWLANRTPLKNQEVADMYDVPNVNTVSRIKNGSRWGHVTPKRPQWYREVK